MTPTARAHASMLLSALLVATSFPVVATISGVLDSAVLTFLRFALASLIFLPLVAIRYRGHWIPSLLAFLRYALLSAPLVGFFVAMFEALRTSNSVNTGALFTLAPGFATVLAFLLLGERSSRTRLIALCLATIGALWVVFRGDIDALMSVDLVIGDAYFVAGTASLGLYVVLIKRLHKGEPMAIVTFWTLVSGTIWLSLFCGPQVLALKSSVLTVKLFAAISYLAVFTTLITFVLTQAAIVVIGPTRTMAYNYLNPTLVALLIWALGENTLNWQAIPGIAMTLSAMLILQRQDSSIHSSPLVDPSAKAIAKPCNSETAQE